MVVSCRQVFLGAGVAFVVLSVMLGGARAVNAQSATAASPAPSAAASAAPSVAPSASPGPGVGSWGVHFEGHSTFISDGTSGPGTMPVEGAGFAGGSPLSPLTPYDTFSSAPLVPGNADESALYVRPTYYGAAFDATVDVGLGYVRGSATNAAYWGENLFATLNPHLGLRGIPLGIVFPTHPGADDVTGVRASVLGGTVASKDGNFVGRVGYFDLRQGDAFVFAQPALTSANPAVGFATPESLGDGAPALDSWGTSSGVLQLDGVDFTAKHGLAQIEYSDATLPSLPGVGQRLSLGSVVIDHGEGTRYSVDYLHVWTGGALVPTTILFGENAKTLVSSQGPLPTSEVGGQSETMFGLRGAFHVTSYLDGLAEYGHANYDADQVAEPGTSRPGNYYHLGVSHASTRGSFSYAAALDAYRNEPYYATAILPYGVAENVWAVAWSWPGQWLKSNYQLINNAPANVNREGYRLKYSFKQNEFDVRLQYGSFTQIEPITLANALRTGFVDGFFLPEEAGDEPSLGRQHQYGLFAAFHPAFGDFTIDYDEDTMDRPADVGHPADHVSYDAPSYVLGYSRSLSKRVLISGSYGRYAMHGSFGQGFTNIDYGQRVYQAGTQLAETPLTNTLLTVRRSIFGGIPAALGDPSPNFTGTLFIIEQRVKI